MENLSSDKTDRLITLKRAAELLSVTMETLLKWNEYNILKPTITQSGEVGYKEEQIQQFLTIRQLLHQNQLTQKPVNKAREEATTEIPEKRQVRRPKTVSVIPFMTITPVVALLTVMVLTRPEIIVSPVQISHKSSQVITSGDNRVSGGQGNTIPLPGGGNPDQIIPGAGVAAYAQTALPDSTQQDISDSVFDNNGNIKGGAGGEDVLAASNYANGMIRSNPVKQTVDLNLIPVIVALASLVAPFVLKKQPVYSGSDMVDAKLLSATDSSPASHEQIVMEVNQKTDGSVVLNYGGQEYRVSKPELDSESDQFIEKLMGLAKTDTQEIDYDVSQDPEMNLGAPLSKLVTRLGFIGLKRELFFPRTSKNRVLFRRYLTERDLTSMDLSRDQLFKELENGN